MSEFLALPKEAKHQHRKRMEEPLKKKHISDPSRQKTAFFHPHLPLKLAPKTGKQSLKQTHCQLTTKTRGRRHSQQGQGVNNRSLLLDHPRRSVGKVQGGTVSLREELPLTVSRVQAEGQEDQGSPQEKRIPAGYRGTQE